MSDSLYLLMISRFVQGFGGSIGSVLAQAICRDAFSGPALGKAYSSIVGALAFFPAVGPIIGGIIIQKFNWPMIFIFLVFCGVLIFLITVKKLPETLSTHQKNLPSLSTVLCQLAKDQKVIGFGLLVAMCNGITFSYYAEGPFYLIELLGLSPSQYGTTFVLMAFSTIIGSLFSAKMQTRVDPLTIISYGLGVILLSNFLFFGSVLFKSIFHISKSGMLILTIASMMANMAGICVVTSNALAISLKDYKHVIGTASSLFGFFYYIGISLCTFGVGLIHNGTLVPMPLYFLGLAVLMFGAFKIIKKPINLTI
jgi:MFS family permease